MHNLRNKLIHYTNDLSNSVDLKAEAIAAIEHIVQYMNEDELLHHSRPLALAYLALTEEVDPAAVVHGRWENGNPICPVCGEDKFKDLDADIWCDWLPPFCPNCGAKMDGGKKDAAD